MAAGRRPESQTRLMGVSGSCRGLQLLGRDLRPSGFPSHQNGLSLEEEPGKLPTILARLCRDAGLGKGKKPFLGGLVEDRVPLGLPMVRASLVSPSLHFPLARQPLL